MSPRPTHEVLERLAYANGTRLLTHDFDRWSAYEPGVFAAHIRCTHSTWGIGEGLLVRPSASGWRVTVTAGAAWNCRGEILAAPVNVTLDAPSPPGAGPDRAFELVLRTPAADPDRCARPFDRCTGMPATPAEPDIEWIAVGNVGHASDLAPGLRLGLDVPLARLTFGNDGTLHNVDTTVRRHARPLRSSRLYAHSTPVETWTTDTDGSRYVRVDTSMGRFARIPVYVAWVDFSNGERLAYGPWVAVEIPKRRAFRARVRMGTKSPAFDVVPATIHWLAAEPLLGCPPLPPPFPPPLPAKPPGPVIL